MIEELDKNPDYYDRPSSAQAAILPFKLLEEMRIPSGYERSIKLYQKTILANRYLLGVNTNAISPKQIYIISKKLGAPASLVEEFFAELDQANLIFIGYEEDAQGRPTFKLYLEFWEKLKKESRSNSPQILHKGFKWSVDSPDHYVTTLYQCYPGIDQEEILHRIGAHYNDAPKPLCLPSINQIIALASNKANSKDFLFVEVSEPGNKRKSFDINIYPAGLKAIDIIPWVLGISNQFECSTPRLQQVLENLALKPLGHISAGLGRDNQEYFTFYYENQ